MLRIFFITLISFLLITNIYSKGLPDLPNGCFDENVYCHNWKILKKNDPENPHGKRVTRIYFFAQLDSIEFRDYHEIIDQFNDFEKWPKFTENSNNVGFTHSVRLPQIIDEDGRVIKRHEAHYWIKGPRIIGGKVNIKEIVHYKEIEAIPGSLTTWTFRHDENYAMKGLKHKTGTLAITYDDDEEAFTVFLIMDAIPEINILPKLAAPYVEAGVVDTFKGMFGLFL